MSNGGRYILAKKIARGGMAEIYLGKQIGEDGFQRLCAIKRILPHYSQDKEFIEMFRDEAHICKRLQHANIVRVEGFEEVEGSYAIIMEFVNGSDLRSILSSSEKASRRLDIPMAVFVVAEAARGLHYAHTKVDEITQQPLGIVHRDISPQNILLSFEGEVKITDFGIADADNKLTETKPGIVKGKYSYMSPEQISAKQVDARTDVFALGIVLWELLTMKRLFQGENEVETIQLVKNCRINYRLRDHNAKIDEELEQIVARALAKDPRKRYQSAAMFEKDLRKYLSVKFSDFTVHELGNFLKKLLDKQRAESASDIKKILTETNQKPVSRRIPGRKRSIDFDAPDDASLKNISVIRGQSAQFKGRATSSRIAAGTVAKRPVPGQQHTGLNRRSAGRTSGGKTSRLVRRPRSDSRFLYFALSVTAVLAFAFYYLYVPIVQPAKLLIRTTPKRVRISINGEKFKDGQYVKTPIGFKVESGKRYVLRFNRAGYRTERIEYLAESAATPKVQDIVLRRTVSVAAVKVKVLPNDQQVLIDINNGYVSEVYAKNQRYLNVEDLALGKAHLLRAYMNPDGEEPDIKCTFIPKSTSWKEPTQVIVNIETKKCSLK